MNATGFLLRTAFFITVLGVCMLLSNVATQGVPSVIGGGSYSTDPNGSWAELLVPLLSGSKEIRIKAAASFEGTLCLYDYEGARKLIEDGIREPILNESFKGSTLINFNLSRRDAYTIVIESHVAEASQGTISIVEPGGNKVDMLQDSAGVTMVGLALFGASGAFKVAHSNRHAPSKKSLSSNLIDPDQKA